MQMRRLEPLVTSKDDRKFVVPFYRSMGMGTHAIAAATGASQGTVRNDLSTEQNYSVGPDRIVGTNGKSYSPTHQPRERVMSTESQVEQIFQLHHRP